MKIAIGADHRGLDLKSHIKGILATEGHEILDLGCEGTSSVDYPEFAHRVAKAVLHREAERGVLICATGMGMSIAANRFKGIRAANCTEPFTARLSRLHNNANILCLGAEIVGRGLAEEIVRVFMTAEFTKEERHLRRVNKIEVSR